jgi:3-amino-4-hydroxybenzoic acid synthase
MKYAWIDIRETPHDLVPAVVQEAVHARVQAIVDRDDAVLSTLPPTVKRVLFAEPGADLDPTARADILVKTVTSLDDLDGLDVIARASREHGTELAAHVVVSDQRTLDLACESARRLPTTLLTFTDPTKIPLEIVIAAADKTKGELVTYAADLEEAGILLGVLEKGSDGIAYAPAGVGQVSELAALFTDGSPKLELEELTVISIEHVGMGDRVCVDTCSHFGPDEGLLLGSFASGFILGCSETHPLPYMPTRPFRVNAGALHSYVLGLGNRTNYLSELHAGSPLLAVRVDGTTRRVVVGRAKLETRPLLVITARSPRDVTVSLTVQDDWHVRVLGPAGSVLNVTDLKPGQKVLGYTLADKRHVGWAVAEFCAES